MTMAFRIAPLSSYQIPPFGDLQRSANSPQKLQKRPFLANFGQLVKKYVFAAQRPFSVTFNTGR